jgi:hypothetical protein
MFCLTVVDIVRDISHTYLQLEVLMYCGLITSCKEVSQFGKYFLGMGSDEVRGGALERKLARRATRRYGPYLS